MAGAATDYINRRRNMTGKERPMLPDRRKLIWQTMLTAEFGSRYWGSVSIRYERLELSLTILIAAFSLGAVASWLGDLVSGLLPTLMAVTGLLSIALGPRQVLPKGGIFRRARLEMELAELRLQPFIVRPAGAAGRGRLETFCPLTGCGTGPV